MAATLMDSWTPSEAPRRIADLLFRLHRTVHGQKQDPDGTPGKAAVIVDLHSDGQFSDPVAIQVAQGRDGRAETIQIGKDPSETAFRIADLLLRKHPVRRRPHSRQGIGVIHTPF